MKKFLLTFLIIAAIVQLFVPTYMIWDRFDVLTTGQEVKIKVNPIDPYDAFRGRYVALRYRLGEINRNGKYGVLKVDDDGFATVEMTVDEKPTEGIYLTSNNDNYFNVPFDRYYMEENMAPKAEKMVNSSDDVYIVVRVKNGNFRFIY